MSNAEEFGLGFKDYMRRHSSVHAKIDPDSGEDRAKILDHLDKNNIKHSEYNGAGRVLVVTFKNELHRAVHMNHLRELARFVEHR